MSSQEKRRHRDFIYYWERLRNILMNPTRSYPPPIRISAALAAFATIAIVFMTGCTALPKGLDPWSLNALPRWVPESTARARYEAQTTASTKSNQPEPIEFKHPMWWRFLNDESLTLLIETGLEESASLRAAVNKVRAIEANLGVAESATQPLISARGAINKQVLSKNYYVPPGFGGKWLEIGEGLGSFSLDLDLWGRQKAAIESIRGQAAAAQAEHAAATLYLSTQIARTYVQLRWAYLTLDELDEILKLQHQTIALHTLRWDLGLDDSKNLDHANDALAKVLLEVERTQARKDTYLSHLKRLVGSQQVVADAVQHAPKGLPEPVLKYSLDQPIPLSLLARRPDLVGARYLVQSSAKQVDVARLAALPNINLTGYLGMQSIGWKKLVESDSKIALLGSVIEFPIFDGGRIRFNTAAKKAEFEMLRAQYENAVSNAAQEVISHVITLKELNADTTINQNRLLTYQRLKERAYNRQQLGIDSRFPSLEANIQYHQQQIVVFESQLKALSNQVDLIVSLGGGYENQAVTDSISAGE